MLKKTCFPVIISAILFFLLAEITTAQERFRFKETIVVTDSLIPAEFSKISRKVTIIKKEEIAKAPVNSVSDLLKSASSTISTFPSQPLR